jgi:hypothetical protein
VCAQNIIPVSATSWGERSCRPMLGQCPFGVNGISLTDPESELTLSIEFGIQLSLTKAVRE